MLKKISSIIIALSIALFSLSGCYKMGEATGEAAEEVEKKADKFEKGYEEGKKK